MTFDLNKTPLKTNCSFFLLQQEPSNKKRKSEGKTKKPYNPGPAPLDKALLEEDDFKRHLDELIRVSSQGKKENERMANSLLKEVGNILKWSHTVNSKSIYFSVIMIIFIKFGKNEKELEKP